MHAIYFLHLVVICQSWIVNTSFCALIGTFESHKPDREGTGSLRSLVVTKWFTRWEGHNGQWSSDNGETFQWLLIIHFLSFVWTSLLLFTAKFGSDMNSIGRTHGHMHAHTHTHPKFKIPSLKFDLPNFQHLNTWH